MLYWEFQVWRGMKIIILQLQPIRASKWNLFHSLIFFFKFKSLSNFPQNFHSSLTLRILNEFFSQRILQSNLSLTNPAELSTTINSSSTSAPSFGLFLPTICLSFSFSSSAELACKSFSSLLCAVDTISSSSATSDAFLSKSTVPLCEISVISSVIFSRSKLLSIQVLLSSAIPSLPFCSSKSTVALAIPPISTVFLGLFHSTVVLSCLPSLCLSKSTLLLWTIMALFRSPVLAPSGGVSKLYLPWRRGKTTKCTAALIFYYFIIFPQTVVVVKKKADWLIYLVSQIIQFYIEIGKVLLVLDPRVTR